ncbi:hypothetical protein IPdc08_01246 [archaeon]|nr:hypothetical protein IPdc08_01246 [archaeon]
MSRKAEKEPVRWLTPKKLNLKIQNKKLEAVILRKLLFIQSLYRGAGVPQAAETVGLSKVTGYIWLEAWNKDGLEGLKPNYGGGRPPNLSKEQKEQLKAIIERRKDWTTKEVRETIKERFKVEYSIRHVSRILRSFRMKYTKPYPYDYRKPENARKDLKKTC